VSARPTELAVTLATFSASYTDWVSADEVRGRLVLLGFDCSTQQVAAWLTRMARTEAPWVERRRDPWNAWSYRVTPFGCNDVNNRLPGVWYAKTTRLNASVVALREASA
jgi:hypothetical protein